MKEHHQNTKAPGTAEGHAALGALVPWCLGGESFVLIGLGAD
jgi:hypothetical protein